MVSLLLMVLVLVKSVKKVPTRLEAVLVGLRNFLHALGSLATSFLDSIEQIHGLTLTHGVMVLVLVRTLMLEYLYYTH